MTRGYVEANKGAYNRLALEYAGRTHKYANLDKALLLPLMKYVHLNFGWPSRALDLGCATGLDLSILENQSFTTIGVDLSEEMLKIAKKRGPMISLVQSDILQLPFVRESFECIVAKAIIHLFTLEDAILVLNHIRNLLRKKGMLYMTTTVNDVPSEGFLNKHGFDAPVARFRRKWTKCELIACIADAGFEIRKVACQEEDELGKTWISVYAAKL